MPINKRSVFGWYGSMHEETQGPEGAIGQPEKSASTGLLDQGAGRQEDGDKARCKGILRTIKREEQKSIWWRINQAIDKPSLGAIPLVQKMENGEVIDITETEEMNKEIQEVTEKRFDLSMSAPITMSLL